MADRKPMDCGDNSCQYEGRSRGGMRTNGGCYCLKDLDFDKRMRAQGYIRHLEAEVARLRAQNEANVHAYSQELTERTTQLQQLQARVRTLEEERAILRYELGGEYDAALHRAEVSGRAVEARAALRGGE
jgi:hypothetical protein